MKLKETNHSYYCSDSNYYVNGLNNWGRCDYETWGEFKEEWFFDGNDIDDDYNHLFRFDIEKREDDYGNKIENECDLKLYFILQRKGIFRPVWIKRIGEKDIKEIEVFLEDRWEYIKGQWIEFSSDNK